ncbi:hypothetical protein Q8A67_018487 [Cirrhinus molitorella]|uniref:Uncharacterized protein n=1 Tax=Cirrhinus molitorella TaxID=172907 RepID=A0AA88TJ21_9TELE|nr:hypothetical protein Q8A67_018487 [Cirrhinus molitorella]
MESGDVRSVMIMRDERGGRGRKKVDGTPPSGQRRKCRLAELSEYFMSSSSLYGTENLPHVEQSPSLRQTSHDALHKAPYTRTPSRPRRGETSVPSKREKGSHSLKKDL